MSRLEWLVPTKLIRFFLLVVGITALQLSASAVPGDLDALKKAFDKPFKDNVRMVLKRRASEDFEVMYKLTVLKDRMVKAEVLQPVMHQGDIMLDDGKSLQYYDPKTKSYLIATSPHRYTPSLNVRMVLIKKNYEILGPWNTKRIDRDATRYIFKAKDSKLGKRYLTIDDETGYTLKSTVIYPNEDAVTLLEVISLESHSYRQEFRLRIPSSIKPEKTWGPVEVRDIKFATGLLGFRPTNPQSLPYGFQMFTQNIIGSQEEPILASKLTDGLNTFTIYQWERDQGKTVLDGELSAKYRMGDTYSTVDGFLPKSIRIELVKAFRPSESPTPELCTPIFLLKDTRKSF